MTTEETKDYKLTFDDSPEAKQRVYDIMLAWFRESRHFTGESLAQSDDTYIDALELLTAVAEEGFKFKQKWNDDDL